MRPSIACVFDMDGTLVDSEPNYFDADRVFLRGYGIDYDEGLRDHMIGRGNLAFFQLLESLWPENSLHRLPMEERMALKDENYLEYARGKTYAFPQMKLLLQMLRDTGIPLAVASGSSPHIIKKSLEFAGIAEGFSALVSAQEVERGKPEPDVFLEAARRLGYPASACFVFEDSQYGVMAALAARMRVIGIPSPVSAQMPPIFSRCHLLFEGGMGEFDAQKALDFVLAADESSGWC